MPHRTELEFLKHRFDLLIATIGPLLSKDQKFAVREAMEADLIAIASEAHAPATPADKLPSVESNSITASSQMGNGEGSQRTCNPQSTLQVPSPEISRGAPATPATRIDTDYAIEHAEYMAQSAEAFMQALNENDGDDGSLDVVNDCWRGLQNAIGQFRKRAQRVVTPVRRLKPGPYNDWCEEHEQAPPCMVCDYETVAGDAPATPATPDEERWKSAAERAGIGWWGCDTAEHMADEIEGLRAQLRVAEAALTTPDRCPRCGSDDRMKYVATSDDSLYCCENPNFRHNAKFDPWHGAGQGRKP